MPNKAFILDLDGVVVDTAHFHYKAWKTAAQLFNYNLTESRNEQLKGVSRVRSLEKVLEWAQVSISQERFDAILKDKNEDYLRQVATMTKDDVLPGVIDFLKEARAAGHKLALGSASKNARAILTKVGLLECFDAIVDGTNVSKAKPDPEVFLQGAELLNATPTDCVVFEDSQAGIKAAKNAGMMAIGLGDAKVLSEADKVYNSFKNIHITIFE